MKKIDCEELRKERETKSQIKTVIIFDLVCILMVVIPCAIFGNENGKIFSLGESIFILVILFLVGYLFGIKQVAYQISVERSLKRGAIYIVKDTIKGRHKMTGGETCYLLFLQSTNGNVRLDEDSTAEKGFDVPKKLYSKASEGDDVYLVYTKRGNHFVKLLLAKDYLADGYEVIAPDRKSAETRTEKQTIVYNNEEPSETDDIDFEQVVEKEWNKTW